MKTITSKEKAKIALEACVSKKAENPVVLDISKVSNIADYFVIVSASSSTRINTIADHVEEMLKKAGCRYCHREGKGESLWVVLDFNDCVVHIFHNEMRDFYNLERLWGDAKVVDFNKKNVIKTQTKRPKKR